MSDNYQFTYYFKYIKYKIKYNSYLQYLELKKNNQEYLLNQIGGTYDNKQVFAEKLNVDYDKLIITEVGKYSITKKYDGEKLLSIMNSILKSTDKIITDLTGCVGGDTILFGLNFKKVYSIEYDKDNYNALQNNVKVFGLNNVKLFYGDATKIYNWYTDVLYFDPPWGGKDYLHKKKLDLYLGTVRIDIFIENILKRENRPKYIFIKLPRNYNFTRLYNIKKIFKIKIIKYKIRGYNIIFITYIL
jgi:hypothetical protein